MDFGLDWGCHCKEGQLGYALSYKINIQPSPDRRTTDKEAIRKTT